MALLAVEEGPGGDGESHRAGPPRGLVLREAAKATRFGPLAEASRTSGRRRAEKPADAWGSGMRVPAASQ